MKFSVAKILAIFLIVSFLSPIASQIQISAQAEYREEDRSDEYYYLAKQTPDAIIPLLDATMSICGADEDGILGDDCTVTASERLLKFEVPENGIGNEVKFKIRNKGTPHYVHLDVSLCWDSNETHIMCDKKHNNVYHDTTKYITTYSIRSPVYYVYIVAEEGSGGDQTEFTFSYTTTGQSNNDRSEPEYIDAQLYDTEIQRYVCESDCSDDVPDPADVFYFEIFKGDSVELELWSRESGSGGDTNRVKFYWRADYELRNYTVSKWFNLEDEVREDTPQSISGVAYQTTVYWLYMIADGTGSSQEAFSYSFQLTIDDSGRDLLSDVDGDGMTDLEEHRCNSDKYDSSDTASDSDGDGICDLRDTDDDGDGIEDSNDPCPTSSFGKADYDNDGCENSNDNDDDDDGVTDDEDRCPQGQKAISSTSTDYDGDGCLNTEDDDDDDDGYPDTMEDTCGTSPLDAYDIPDDFDKDGVCDALDSDDDGDGIDDVFDTTCPNTPKDSNDYDGDGCEDALDRDDDDDGYDDDDDLCRTSNTVLVGTQDYDLDGCFDDEDTDDDNDSWSDADEERCLTDSRDIQSLPTDTDGDFECDEIDQDDDGDGWSDEAEKNCRIGNSLNADVVPMDNDNDWECDELDSDDDNDGWSDEIEQVCGDGDPLVSGIRPNDHDGDEICDGMDEDIDGDSIENDYDNCPKTPLSQIKEGDLDGDGCFDGGEDPDIDDDQVPNLSDKCPTTFTNAANDLDSDGCDDDEVFSALISSTTPIIVLIVVLAIAGFVIVKMRSGTNVNVIDSSDVEVNIDQSDSRGSINENTWNY